MIVSVNPLSGLPSCDVAALPLVEEWPLLPNHSIHMGRLEAFGVIELDEVLDAMRQCPRGVHGLPFPLEDEIQNLDASSLRVPWWVDTNMPHSLLPGLFETSQILQLLQVTRGDSVLLLGPRGNWWTELLMYIGASHIVVVEYDQTRREVLEERWNSLRLNIVASAFGCDVEFVGVGDLEDVMPDGGFDRLLSTGMFQSLPLNLMMRVNEEGYAVLPILNEGRSMLQLIQHHGKGELMAQWVACWEVDAWPEEFLIALETNDFDEEFVPLDIDSRLIENAWLEANSLPTRDRFGPARMLDMIERVWFSIDPVHTDVIDGEVGGFRERMADDLFRMGHVLLQMGIFELAAEHQGESFRLAPTAESATFLGWALSEMDDLWGALGWCRKAIETDERLGNPWNDIGAILMEMEQPAAAIPWLANATRSQRYDAQGHPWSNLAKAHEMLGNKMAAFEAARNALEHCPDDDSSLRIIEDLSGFLL
ncbi:MAG: hypothetical protein CMB37_01370 [Euryarchaeota archaeon]|nr:hypothetical protein [Euryarchaeota archaeon]|tara:strand:- start:59 stop:1498 length:1440 start_codon:yes stop_codon:yes gene_type:complete